MANDTKDYKSDKDVMKKAEELEKLARTYAEINWVDSCCGGDYCEVSNNTHIPTVMDIFKAGYKSAQELHEAETKMLVEAMETAQKFMFESKYYNYNESEPEFQMICSLEYAIESYYRSRGTKET